MYPLHNPLKNTYKHAALTLFQYQVLLPLPFSSPSLDMHPQRRSGDPAIHVAAGILCRREMSCFLRSRIVRYKETLLLSPKQPTDRNNANNSAISHAFLCLLQGWASLLWKERGKGGSRMKSGRGTESRSKG